MPEDAIQTFTRWAKERGISISGVEATHIPSRGIGIVASRDLREGERVLFIPRAAMITPATKDVAQLDVLEACEGQARIAAYLTLSSQRDDYPFHNWEQTWPSVEELQSFMPYFWPMELKSLLPPSAVSLLKRQSLSVAESWRQVKRLIPKSQKSLFLYYYFIINSRTMYWRDTDSRGKQSSSPANDLALVPFLDFLNHSPSCQPATCTRKGYEIVTERKYAAGEEIFVSYGAHPDDFLLVEYGFLPEPGSNPWDSLNIDHLVIPPLSASQKETLESNGFLGDYTLFLGGSTESPPELCFRTLVALYLVERGVCNGWVRFKDGIEDNRRPGRLPHQIWTAVSQEVESLALLLKTSFNLTEPQEPLSVDPVRKRLEYLISKYQSLLQKGILAPWIH